MTDRLEATSFPLTWPHLWPRTPWRRSASFGRHSFEEGAMECLRQLKLMKVPDFNVIISTNVALRRDGLPYSNQAAPADPGVAVWFKLTIAGEQRNAVLACDRWAKVEHNLWAVCKHIEALRLQERWGVGSIDQAFTGYLALPPAPSKRAWYTVLGFTDPVVAIEDARTCFRELAKRYHPDVPGGSQVKMQELNEAWAEAQKVCQ